jgi:hypothetical protein
MCGERGNTLYIREERKNREKVILYHIDAAGVKENAGKSWRKNLETFKRLRVRAHEREERVKIHVELITTQVHLVLYTGLTINIA